MPYHGEYLDHQILVRANGLVVGDGQTLPERWNKDLCTLAELRSRAREHRGPDGAMGEVDDVVKRYYLRISHSYCVSRQVLRPADIVALDAERHPAGISYAADARLRAVAHGLDRSYAVLGGWSSLALMGLHEFSHGADACYTSKSQSRPAPHAAKPRLIRCKVPVQPWTIAVRGRRIRSTPPVLALAQCLRAVRADTHSWWVPQVPGLDPIDVRAVQLIDRFRRLFQVTAGEVAAALFGLVDARWVRRMCRMSDGGADSPPETLTRLIAKQVAATHGVHLRSQVPVGLDGGPYPDHPAVLTVLDLADPDRRVAVMYDGAHHLERSQRDKDARITADLQAAGWRVLRISAGMLRDSADLMRRLARLFQPAAA